MSGLINKVITDGSTMLIGSVPGSKFSTVNLLVVNDTNIDQDIAVYICDAAKTAPGQVDLIEARATLLANGGRVEYSCVVASAGEQVFIRCAAGLVARLSSVDEQ